MWLGCPRTNLHAQHNDIDRAKANKFMLFDIMCKICISIEVQMQFAALQLINACKSKIADTEAFIETISLIKQDHIKN